MFEVSYLGNKITNTLKFYIQYQSYSSFQIVCWSHQKNLEMSCDIHFPSSGIVHNRSNILFESQPTPSKDTQISYVDASAPYRLTHHMNVNWENLFSKYPSMYDNFLILHISQPELISDIRLECEL